MPDSTELSIDEYLRHEIGVVPLKSTDDPNRPPSGSPYTPQQVIKWVANKEGAAHFDFDKPSTLRAAKSAVETSGHEFTDDFLVKFAIYQIANWTIDAIDYVLRN